MEKGLKVVNKIVAHPFDQKPEKNNEVGTPLPPPPPSAVSATPLIAPSKSFTAAAPAAKSVMDARVARRRAEKKTRLQKQLSKNTEKLNVTKKQKLS